MVHLEHGIGIYRGIETIIGGRSTLEVAVVEYEGGDRLNVPLYRLDQLERYRAAGEDGDRPPPRLHRLGGNALGSECGSAPAQAIKEMTAELLDLYARRTVAAGYAFPPDTAWQRELESSFLFEDTPDQRTATEEVKRDMERPRPMDRLLVGDVGYGKTEIAVRAAFKAVQGGKQVAVLVPTTILAEQHGRTFSERLADFPVQDRGALPLPDAPRSRRRRWRGWPTAKIDIVIGTHRLLSKDVHFKDLGLLVVDEEHRFGVKHKERLKALRLAVDVLTLTATPIPRTLHLSLAGSARPHADRDAAARPLARPHFRRAVGRRACSRRRSRASSTAAARCSSSTTGSRPSTRSPPGCARSRRAPGSAWRTARCASDAAGGR